MNDPFDLTNVDRASIADPVVNLIDDLAAALETVLLCYGRQMPPADLLQRSRLVETAQQFVASCWPDPNTIED
jgi:hypothetical protein